MRREKILEGRNREIKLKEKLEKAAALRAEKAAATEEKEVEEDLVSKAEEDFWSMISNERANLEKKRAKAKKQAEPGTVNGEDKSADWELRRDCESPGHFMLLHCWLVVWSDMFYPWFVSIIYDLFISSITLFILFVVYA